MPFTEKKEEEEEKKEEEEVKFYREAFNNFDWNSSGTIPTKVSKFLPFLDTLGYSCGPIYVSLIFPNPHEYKIF
jgi:Ca2+-binding EF-hand superfamily protein